MKKIFIKKSVIVGSILYKPGSELSLPKDINEVSAQGFIDDGFAVDVEAKFPAPEKEADVVAAIASAKDAVAVGKAIDSVEKPSPGILAAAAEKVKSFSVRPAAKKPGERK